MFTDDIATTSTPPAAVVTAAAGSNSGEEDKSRVFDGGFGGNRWPRQETLALLKIRSDMDSAFRDASVKAPLWEEVSRKLAGLGYHRSAKKCKEKFENVYKYHRRTKDGRTSKGSGKTYRFFDQLEAFGHNHHSPSHKTVSLSSSMPSMPGVSLSNVSTVPSNVVQLTLPPFTNPPTTHPTMSFQSTDLMLSDDEDSSSSNTSSDLEVGGSGRSRKKRKRKWKVFFDRLMKEVIDKQEDLQRKFLEAIEKREQDRVVRKEAWRVQELNRINKEREILAQERKIAAAKDSAVMAFLQKLSDQQPIHHSPPPSQPPQPPPPPPQPTSMTVQSTSVTIQPTSVKVQQIQMSPPGFTTTPVLMADNGGGSSSRWPKVEVEALINLRTNLDSKYQENGPKGQLWEEISNGMKKLGYNRSSKRCKEKWENINKYFKKVKESNKKRPEDSKTCPYFHQLDALYMKKGKFDDNSISNVVGLVRPENSVPLMVQPEQQWPPAEEDRDKDDDEDGDDDGGDGDDDDDGFEIVANKPASMNAAQ